MEKESKASVVRVAPANEISLGGAPLDTRTQFEAWLDNLRPSQPINRPPSQASPVDHPTADFFVECDEGTDCRISFEGVLHLSGLLSGTIQSEAGTLVTGCGIIEGNINVGGAAFIEGSVTGDIRAGERVVLYPQAKVWGNIISTGLSVQPGALFQGDCTLHEGIARRLVAPAGEVAGELGDQFQGQFQGQF